MVAAAGWSWLGGGVVVVVVVGSEVGGGGGGGGNTPGVVVVAEEEDEEEVGSGRWCGRWCGRCGGGNQPKKPKKCNGGVGAVHTKERRNLKSQLRSSTKRWCPFGLF